jgi:hypothetical protein
MHREKVTLLIDLRKVNRALFRHCGYMTSINDLGVFDQALGGMLHNKPFLNIIIEISGFVFVVKSYSYCYNFDFEFR